MNALPALALAVAVALTAAAFGFAPAPPTAAAPDCGPIQGAIAVADDDRITPDMARISEADARTAALTAVPDASVTDVDLDEEDGFLVYEVDLVRDGTEVDVLVDAGTGEVLCTEED